MSKKIIHKLNLLLLVLFILTLIGIPGFYKGFTTFNKGADFREFKIQKLADGSYLTKLTGLKKNSVPVFNLSSATNKIDFASLSDLASNVYYLGETIINPGNQEELKILEKRTKVNGKKKFEKIAAIGLRSLYQLNSNNLDNIQALDLSLIVADLGIFNSNCFLNLTKDSKLAEICPEINYNLPFKIEYFEIEDLIEAYIIPTNDPVWTALGVYSNQVEVIYGQGKAKKLEGSLGKRSKAKVANLRKGKILTVGTFKIAPAEIVPDLQINLDDPL